MYVIFGLLQKGTRDSLSIFIKYWGIIGASITTLISQIVVNIFTPALFKETRSFVGLFMGSFSRGKDLSILVTSTLRRVLLKSK